MRRATGAVRGAWAILARPTEARARSLSQIAGVGKVPLAPPALLFSRKDSRYFADKSKEDLPPPPPPVKLPKFVSGIHSKYASAIYVAAVRANAIDDVDNEMRVISATYAESDDLRAFAEDIFLDKKERVQGIKKAFGDVGLHEITMSFLTILAEDAQLRLLPKAARVLAELVDAHKGRIQTVITTADEASSADLDFIKQEVVGKLLAPGQSAIIRTRVDEDIIGGCIVEVGDKLVDMSLGKRIVQIEKVLNEALSEMDSPSS